jgi:L-lactate dehydrogenase complex protein LldE
MFNGGYFDQASSVAKHFIEVFENTDGEILCPSASCTAMVRHHYSRLFENDPAWSARAKKIADRTYEFSEYLVKKANIDLATLGARFPDSVTYHYSCHLRAIGIHDEPIRLIRSIAGIDYRPLAAMDQCCGFGGTFSMNFPHLSESLVKNKVQTIQDTQANWLIFSDAGCAMNITGYANRIGRPIRAMHLAELIAKSLGACDES